MKHYKIYVYAICKNEEKHVEQWVASMGEADAIVVTDTGSTDGTVARLRERGVAVYEETIDPWRFDTARNRSLDRVPEDADICVCTDLDERFEPGWREKLEAAWTADADGGDYIYNWSLRADGGPGTQFIYFKIHRRAQYTWVYPVHECLQYTGPLPEKRVFIPGMVLNHYPDAAKARSSYLPLLEKAVEEAPLCDRMRYYLGREYLYAGQWRACIDTLQAYLKLPDATWDEERCAAMRWIAAAYDNQNQPEAAEDWYFRAIAEYPDGRDAYVEFAKMAYAKSDWTAVFFLTEEALKIKNKSETYINMEYAWDATPYDLAALACYHLGAYGQAALYAKNAVARAPNDRRLQNNLKLIEEKWSSGGSSQPTGGV